MLEEKRIHICGWDLVSAMRYDMRVPRYAAGPGRNVPAPLGTAAYKRLEQSALDYNPGADLQAVTVLWGSSTRIEQEHDQE